MTDGDNPYLERTREVLRPTANQVEFQSQSHEALRTAQRQWEAAEIIQDEIDTAETNALVMRDQHREEPVSKALENRLRIAFLAVKGATMQQWIEHRDEILSRWADDESRR